MLSGRKKVLSTIQAVLLLVVLMSQITLPIAFAATDPMDESRIDSIIWEIIGGPCTNDPHVGHVTLVHPHVYETLITYPWDTADTTPTEPLLAENVHISSDGLNYTFTLRQDVTFHDGTPFNASCVQMNFWRMLGRGWHDGFGPLRYTTAEHILGGRDVMDAVLDYGEYSTEHLGNWTDWVENSGAVEVLDTYEVRIRLAYPYAPFLAVLALPHCSMASPTFFMAHGGMSPESDDWYMDLHTCGTGPYKLTDWIQDHGLEFTINEDYWRSDIAKYNFPGAGSIKELSFSYVNRDANSRMLNLQAGTTDMCYWSILNAYDIWNNVTERGDGTLQSLNPDIKVWTGEPNYNVMFLGFNMNPTLNYSGEIVQNPFQDWELRTAISYAFDYDALIGNLMNGMVTPLAGCIPQGLFGHDDTLLPYEQDLDVAVTHWNLAMDDGLDDVWQNSSFVLNIYYNQGNDARETAGHLVKQALEEIIAHPSSADPSSSLTINVIGLEWGGRSQPEIYGYEDLLRNRELPIYFLGWAPDFADPHNYILPFVKSDSRYPYRMGLEGSTGEDGIVWDDETVDGWIDSAVQTQDPAERLVFYEQIQDAIVDHCAFIWGYQGVEFHVERHELNGYVFNPMRKPYFYHYYKGVMTPIPAALWIQAAAVLSIIVIALVILRRSSKR